MVDKVLSWFAENGGRIHSDITLKKDDEYGCHFVSDSDLDENANVCHCPFRLSLSYLNCLPNPPDGIRSVADTSVCKHLVGKVETNTIATFLLAEERLKGDDSFWVEYIKLLPRESDLCTPLWFERADLVWLRGTNLYSSPIESETAVGLREAMYKNAWKAGITTLDAAGMDSKPFTWELCLWAATIFSSRSFTSKIMAESKGDSFSLLYPVIDYFNHGFGEKVVWDMEKGNFSLILTQGIQKGNQILNNYAPKGNEELLMGYGFCIPDNPCDQILLRIAKPPPQVHAILKAKIPNHFISDTWIAEESGFYVRGHGHYSGGYPDTTGHPALRGIPLELAMSMQALVSHFHDFKESSEDPKEELWYATVDTIIGRLQQKRSAIQIEDNNLPDQPLNNRQKQAKIYRDGQIQIFNEVIEDLESCTNLIDLGQRTAKETFHGLPSIYDE